MKSEPLPINWVTKIFMQLHGRFGNTFFDKYRIGTLNESGQDMGIENAKQVWAQELAGTSPERISMALMASYDYPPSCDDFKMNCAIKAQQPIYTALPAPNNKETNKAFADNVVKFISEHTAPKADYKAWAKRILANPQNFPDSSLTAAKEAMKAAA
jgi:hypothetical protein